MVDDAFVIFHCRALCDDQRDHARAGVGQPVHSKGAIEYSDRRAGLLNYGIIFSNNLCGELGLGSAETGQFGLAAFRRYVARHYRAERIYIDAARGLDWPVEFVRGNPGAGKCRG